MKLISEILTLIFKKGFVKAGYNEKYGIVNLSNRLDLCQYQCNGCLSAAKIYKKSPIDIAHSVVKNIKPNSHFKEISVVKPGFINITLSDDFITDYINDMYKDDKLGCDNEKTPKTIIVDYGGANIAKPLHVGHLRSAIIGESIKRINRFKGHNVTSDVHLGDWGLQMGMVITELKERKPHLPYFDDNYDRHPSEPPLTIDELSDIYPTGSKKAKENTKVMDEARLATAKLQEGHKGYMALWKYIYDISIADLKKNYGKLNVQFDLWKGESDCQSCIPKVVDYLKQCGITEVSNGALIVPVELDTDKKPMPPFMVLKSDGAALYSTTDLTTIYQRIDEYNPDDIIYVVDKRQNLHFEQVFRCARKSNIAKDNLYLKFIGFGTMNGKDGKPFKTRDGGIMRLEDVIKILENGAREKLLAGNENYDNELIDDISIKVGLAALKYSDLSNQFTKDYVFDLERFTNFHGKTGPYIQYSIVRMKSILKKVDVSEWSNHTISNPQSETEMNIMLKLIEFNSTIDIAYRDYSPSKICDYAYEVSTLFNRFYHETRIISEDNKEFKSSWINLLSLGIKVLEKSLWLLGIDSLERM
ncbi:arginine--tRNA ligase [Clostridiaceae bacterium M8S5]|nr:arginine--tRNA ligase [Clostridiaceae bacterium M8S5]